MLILIGILIGIAILLNVGFAVGYLFRIYAETREKNEGPSWYDYKQFYAEKYEAEEEQ